MAKNFKLNSSLTIENDLNIKGNLNVLGETNTVKAETLTVKDNFIAINNDGTTLNTIDKAGIVVVDGGEVSKLKDGKYYIDPELFYKEAGVYVDPNSGEDFGQGVNYLIYANNPSIIEKFILLNLSPKYVKNKGSNDVIELLGNIHHTDSFGDFVAFLYSYYYSIPGDVTSISQIVLIYVGADNPTTPNYVNEIDYLEFENQLIKKDAIDFLCKFLRKYETNELITSNDFTTEATAYASPIYDRQADSLKIGLGTYEKDSNENVTGFTFGAGQGQSIATRDENIQNNNLVAWNSQSNKIIDSNLSVDSIIDEKKLEDALSKINVDVDLSEYQKKTDNSLQTNNKDIVNAINEINGRIINNDGNGLIIDDQISSDSVNPVQNKVIKQVLDGKVNAIENTSGEKVYTQNASNETILIPVSEYVVANTLAKRNGGGRVQTATPVNDNDCLNRKWFTDNFRTFWLHKLDFGNNIYLNILTIASLAFTKEEVVDSATGTTLSYATKTNMDYVFRVQLQSMWVSDERQGLLREVYNPQITIGNGEGNLDTPLTNKGILNVSCDILGEQVTLNCSNFIGDTVSRYHI